MDHLALARRATERRATIHPTPDHLGRLGSLLCAALLLAASAGDALAAESWTTVQGRTALHFNVGVLEALDLSLTSISQTEAASQQDLPMEGPLWYFSIVSGEGVRFEVKSGDRVVQQSTVGVLAHQGSFALRDNRSGRAVRFENFEVVPSTETAGAFFLRNPGATEPSFRIDYPRTRFSREAKSLHVAYFDLVIEPELAADLGRPDLADWTVGSGQIHAESAWAEGHVETAPARAGGDCNAPDAQAADVFSLTYFGRTGTVPTGTIGLAMGGSICNLGDCDILWRSPMDERHPGFGMALYRVDDDRFEQIGTSWVKHAFLALSFPGCGIPCQQPENDADLGIGCEDTYGAFTNAERTYLGPRDEWLSFPGTWECTGSHFADGQPDCARRHDGGDPHDPVEHRLQVEDADMIDDADAYYFEGVYLIPDDVNKENNWAHRPTSFTRNGDAYQFTGEPGDAVEGPALRTWGGTESQVAFAGDGEILLSHKVTDLGGGEFAYEYALMNLDADLGVKSFRVPIGSAVITNIGFHDPNADALDDWTATIVGDEIVWETADNPITWGHLYNFRFVADTGGMPSGVIAESFTGNETAVLAATTPGDAANVPERVGAELELRSVPNPMSGRTTIQFALTEAGPIQLDLYDSSGRRVRGLLAESFAAGIHDVGWDGMDELGQPVAAGVYYANLRAAGTNAVHSILVLR